MTCPESPNQTLPFQVCLRISKGPGERAFPIRTLPLSAVLLFKEDLSI